MPYNSFKGDFLTVPFQMMQLWHTDVKGSDLLKTRQLVSAGTGSKPRTVGPWSLQSGLTAAQVCNAQPK